MMLDKSKGSLALCGALIVVYFSFSACNTPAVPTEKPTPSMTYGDDLSFLQKHAEVVVLADADSQAQVVVSPRKQGRVLTSTSGGDSGPSYGWINRELIASGERQDHINVFGSEDRFWLGPEGGQYSIYFEPESPFDLEHWHVPAPIDWDPFRVVLQEHDRIVFEQDMELVNYSGTRFNVDVSREVRLLGHREISDRLGETPSSVVAYESVNRITNRGEQAWTKERGLLSIWILGMYNPSPATTVVIPYLEGSEEEHGPIVNAAYFGDVPPSRLVIDNGVVFFRGDGEYRSKIGFTSWRSAPNFGSYDADNGVLTLIQYFVADEGAPYVNSMWELQSEPYAGDVINSYNDGPPESGAKPLGPFYELETSSPAAELEPGKTLTHTHRILHLQGIELNRIAIAAFGRSLEEVRNVFGS